MPLPLPHSCHCSVFSLYLRSYDFIPDVLSRDGNIDTWIKIGDDEAFAAAHRLIRTEGLLVGGSSGSAVAGALGWLKSDEGWKRVGGVEGANAVILLPDGYVAVHCRTLFVG